MTSRILLVVALIGTLSLMGSVAWAADEDAPDPGGAGNGAAAGGDAPDPGAAAGGDAPDPGEGDGGEGDKDGKKDDEEKKGKDEGGGGLFSNPMLIMMVVVIVGMLYMSSRGRKKQAAKQNDLLSGLKKGDKVRTIGGILGSVVEVRNDEVVLKIDENSNARMRVIRKAISGTVVDGKKDDEDGK